jgi:hypothetical protein
MKKYFFLLFLLIAQTLVSQSIIEEKHNNGLVKTRYHIQQKDTILIEYFGLNGNITTRHWRDDSTYSYANERELIAEKRYKNKARTKSSWATKYLFPNHRSRKAYLEKVIHYYPDGKIKAHYFWVGDSIFKELSLLPNGNCYHMTVYQQLTNSIFSLIDSGSSEKTCFIRDTSAQTLQKTYWTRGKLIKQIVEDSIGLVQKTFFDSTGRIEYSWQRDTNRLKPDKNNALCLYGFRNRNDNWVIAPKYENVIDFNYIYFIVNENNKYGIVDEFGQVIVPPQWDFLQECNDRMDANIKDLDTAVPNTYLICKKGKLYGVIDNFGKMILEPVYQYIRKYKKGLFEVQIGKYWGVIDKNGQIIVAPNHVTVEFTDFDDVFITTDTLSKLSDENPWYEEGWGQGTLRGLVNRTGQTLLNKVFSDIRRAYNYPNGCFWVTTEENGFIGLFDAKRGWLLDTQSFNSEVRNSTWIIQKRVKNKDKPMFGICTPPDAQLVLPIEYQNIECFEKNIYNPTLSCKTSDDAYKSTLFYICKKEEKWGIFDFQKRDWLIPLKYDYIHFLSNNVLIVLQDGKWQFMNLQQQTLLPECYEDAGWTDLNSHSIYVRQHDRLILYSSESFPYTYALLEKKPIEKKCFKAKPFKSAIFYHNSEGHVLMSAEDTLLGHDEDFLIIQNKYTKKQQLIDYQGLKKQFSSSYQIHSLHSKANTIIIQDTARRKVGAITLDENIILPCNYFSVTVRDKQNVFWAKQDAPTLLKNTIYELESNDTLLVVDKNWQIFDSTGKLLSALYFDYPFEWSNHLGIGQVAGKQGLWNCKGQPILPPQYDKIWYDTLSKIFHLFQFKDGQQNKVRFANADGQLIINENLSNMSNFSGDYALVETQAGEYGVIRQNGQYLIEPEPFALQQSRFNVASFLSAYRDSVVKHSSKSGFYLFKSEYDTNRVVLLDTAQRRLFENVVLEQYAQQFFLNGKHVWNRRNNTRVFELHFLGNYNHLTHDTEFLFDKKSYYSIYARKPYTYNLQFKNNIWKNVPIDSVLLCNEVNIMALNRLLVEKLGAVKNQAIDCGDPSLYFQQVKNLFFILPEGLKFFMPTHQYESSSFVSLLLTWDELKPFLNY